MADYYPLLAKTFSGLSDTGPAMRQTVYGRARQALTGQLRQLTPALSDAEIDKEGSALERAIARIEATFADAGPEAPPSPAAPPQPVPQPVPQAEPAAPASANEAVATVRSMERPAPKSPIAIRKGGRKRSMAVPIGIAVLAVPVGLAAWLWRDRSEPVVPSSPVAVPTPVGPTASTETKFGERVGGGGSAGGTRPAAAPPPAPSSSSPVPASPPVAAPVPRAVPAERPAAPAAVSPPAAEAPVSIAQRAMLFEESTPPQTEPKLTTGRALWRLDAVNAGQGLPLETVVQGRIDIPPANLAVMLTIRRNVDAALPASHTIELTFTTPSGDPSRTVRDVNLPMMRAEETIRGIALAGLPVPVKENVFLIGLSDLKSDVEKNTELLTNRSWMELPIRFASGQKAVLLFEKGVSGDRVMSDAFKQWASTP